MVVIVIRRRAYFRGTLSTASQKCTRKYYEGIPCKIIAYSNPLEPAGVLRGDALDRLPRDSSHALGGTTYYLSDATCLIRPQLFSSALLV